MTAPQARLARPDDCKGVGVALGNAFGDDPVFSFIAPRPDVATRRKRLGPFFAAEARTKVKTTSVWTTDDHAGAAIWARPGEWKTPMLKSLGMAIPFFRAAASGTDPSRQGQGVGSAVMRPVLDTCDEDGVGAYLESSKESNIPFYERHGFRVTGEIHIPDGPTLWAMWRDPVIPQ